jgi:hypothetical protein
MKRLWLISMAMVAWSSGASSQELVAADAAAAGVLTLPFPEVPAGSQIDPRVTFIPFHVAGHSRGFIRLSDLLAVSRGQQGPAGPQGPSGCKARQARKA